MVNTHSGDTLTFFLNKPSMSISMAEELGRTSEKIATVTSPS